MRTIAVVTTLVVVAACGPQDSEPGVRPGGEAAVDSTPAAVAFPADTSEPRLRNIYQLTDGGENAEAYFSADGTKLIFQANHQPEIPCDQMFVMNIDGSNKRRVSAGAGRTTCGYFFPAGNRLLFSSTHLADSACPPPPDYSRGYVWPLDNYDIFTAMADGTDLRQLTNTPGYDAEATISPDGSRIVFTSIRDGDLDIYVMDADGSNVTRLTSELGYDGGPFFSPDGKRIVFRANHPTGAEVADYKGLLAAGMVRPGKLDIWVMDADGKNKRQVTKVDGASFAPFFHPSGEKIIFSSNLNDPNGRNFDLYLINLDGTGLERVTTHGEFDGFPMFSPDGTKLVFASNRGAKQQGDTNIFIVEWVETLTSPR